MQSIGTYFSLQRGKTYSSRLLGQPGPVLLGLGSIERNGGFRDSSLKTYGGESAENLLVQPGEMYVSLKDVTQSGDLLGAVARVPNDGVTGRLTQDTVKLIPKSKNIPKSYLYWLMRTPEYRRYCRSHATGTTNLGLAREDFLAYPAPFPTAAQSAASMALDVVERKIRVNDTKCALLRKQSSTIFRAWFLEFLPNAARASGASTFRGVPQDIYDLLPGDWTDSRYGRVPTGWHYSTIAGECSLAYGRALKATSRIAGNVPVYGSNGQVGWHNERLVVGPGIVVGRKGNPGTVTWVQTDFFPIDTTFYVVLKDGSNLSLQYVRHYLDALDLPRYAADSAVPGLGRGIAYGLQILVPDAATVRAFSILSDTCERAILTLRSENIVLQRMQVAILSHLASMRNTNARVEDSNES